VPLGQGLHPIFKGPTRRGELLRRRRTCILCANGLTAQNLYDYAEDFTGGGEPTWETALAIELVRRDYFLNAAERPNHQPPSSTRRKCQPDRCCPRHRVVAAHHSQGKGKAPRANCLHRSCTAAGAIVGSSKRTTFTRRVSDACLAQRAQRRRDRRLGCSTQRGREVARRPGAGAPQERHSALGWPAVGATPPSRRDFQPEGGTPSAGARTVSTAASQTAAVPPCDSVARSEHRIVQRGIRAARSRREYFLARRLTRLSLHSSDCADHAKLNRVYRLKVPAAPERVFPLLCPILEYKWLANWHLRITQLRLRRRRGGLRLSHRSPRRRPDDLGGQPL